MARVSKLAPRSQAALSVGERTEPDDHRADFGRDLRGASAGITTRVGGPSLQEQLDRRCVSADHGELESSHPSWCRRRRRNPQRSSVAWWR